MRLSFPVYGTPAPKGSLVAKVPTDKRGFPLRYKKTGRIIVFQEESNAKRLKLWMAAIAKEARKAMKAADLPLITGPVVVSCLFQFERPKCHYGTGRNRYRVKASAPRHHTQIPDVSKLIRAVEDAMTGVVYVDDAQIVRYGEPLGKEWTEGTASAVVTIEPLETAAVGMEVRHE